MPPARPGTAFTLVELLVVLGVIALLLAILLPTLAAVRRSARTTACASNQRQVTHASLARAADCGYLPLAGVLYLPPDTTRPGTLPAALNDAARTRYSYRVDDLGDGTTISSLGEQVPPPPMSLLAYLGDDPDGDFPGQKYRRMIDLHAPMALWLCPSEDREPYQTNWPAVMSHVYGLAGDAWENSTSGDGWGTVWFPRTDYAYNEAVTGFHFDRRYAAARANGHLAAVRAASETMLLADAVTYKPIRVPLASFHPRLTLTPTRVTLADVRNNAANVTSGTPVADRHAGRANVAFLDGHAAAVAAGEDDGVLLMVGE